MTSELVHLDITDGVATVTLDSPQNRNALSRQLTAELQDRVERAIGDERSRVIVLTGTGTVFCSGADLKEQREANQSGGQTGPVALVPTLKALWNSPKPVVGRINGAARAGGVGLVAACDFAVAEESATFGLSEVRIGVIPAIISVVLLPKLGPTRCTELFLTGEPFDARAAQAYGLLNAVLQAGKLDDGVQYYIEMLRKGAPGALAGTKRLIREIPLMDMAPAFEEAGRRSATHFASAEALEGMIAFLEKRPPHWA
jgi:methylglutaconyl-CoA hydratase